MVNGVYHNLEFEVMENDDVVFVSRKSDDTNLGIRINILMNGGNSNGFL